MLIRDVLIAAKPAEEPPFRGWVHTVGPYIHAVGRDADPAPADSTVVEGRGRALIPGLVNAHAHSHSSLTRGTAEGMPLETWLQAGLREQSRMTEEHIRLSALATYGEALLSGTTAIFDMCIAPEIARDAARDIGIRAMIAPRVADRMRIQVSLQHAADFAMATARDERVRGCIGLHDLESASDGLIREAAALAQSLHLPLHLHCAESQHWTEKTRVRTGRSPVRQLENLGVLSPGVHLAHCVWTDERDREVLAAHDVSVAHCPHSNLKLGSGIAAVTAMRKAGVRVSLGTDGARANNRLDMFDVMKFASLLAKGTELDATALLPADVLTMATREGARTMDSAAAEIAPGRPADITLVAVDRFHLQPALPDTIVTNLVHAARGADVDMVLVDGVVVVEGGRLALVDQDELLARYVEAGRELLRN